jgi:Protein of unknown function (DUF2586)
MLPGISIQPLSGQLGLAASGEDHVSGIILALPASGGPYGGLAGSTFTFNSLDAVKAAGFSIASDLAAHVNAYSHFEGFFKQNPKGMLWVMVALQGATMADMLDPDGIYAMQLLSAAGGAIRQLGVVLNPDNSYTPVDVGGIEEATTDALYMGDNLATAAAAAMMPLLVVVEGRSYGGNASAVADLRDLNLVNCCCVIAQDAAVRASDAMFEGTAAVGHALGSISAASVHESIAWVGKFDVSKNRPFEAGFSSDTLLASHTLADLGSLHDKGYLFWRRFPGQRGLYWAGDPTTSASDGDYNAIRLIRTMQKAIRGTYAALLPLLNSPLLVEKSTGKMQKGVIASWEAIAGAPLLAMQADGEISGYDVFLDPDQNVSGLPPTVLVKVAIVPIGCAEQIVEQISFAVQITN